MSAHGEVTIKVKADTTEFRREIRKITRQVWILRWGPEVLLLLIIVAAFLCGYGVASAVHL